MERFLRPNVFEHAVVVHLGRDPTVRLVKLSPGGVAQAGGQCGEESEALSRERRRGGSLEGRPRGGGRGGRLHHGRQQREQPVDGRGGAASSRHSAPESKCLGPQRGALRRFVPGSNRALHGSGDHAVGAEPPGVLWG